MKDYISRQKFIVTCVDVYCKNCDRRKNGKGKMVYEIGDVPCRACDIRCVLDDVEIYPAAEVAPVRHGRWLETDAAPHRIYCSECYATFIQNREWIAWKENMIPRKYCPNCGAKMDWEVHG